MAGLEVCAGGEILAALTGVGTDAGALATPLLLLVTAGANQFTTLTRPWKERGKERAPGRPLNDAFASGARLPGRGCWYGPGLLGKASHPSCYPNPTPPLPSGSASAQRGGCTMVASLQPPWPVPDHGGLDHCYAHLITRTVQ